MTTCNGLGGLHGGAACILAEHAAGDGGLKAMHVSLMRGLKAGAVARYLATRGGSRSWTRPARPATRRRCRQRARRRVDGVELGLSCGGTCARGAETHRTGPRGALQGSARLAVCKILASAQPARGLGGSLDASPAHRASTSLICGLSCNKTAQKRPLALGGYINLRACHG